MRELNEMEMTAVSGAAIGQDGRGCTEPPPPQQEPGESDIQYIIRCMVTLY